MAFNYTLNNNNILCYFNYTIKELNYYDNRFSILNLIWINDLTPNNDPNIDPERWQYFYTLKSPNVVRDIIKQYRHNIESLLNAQKLNPNLEVPQSKTINTKLYPFQYNDLNNILKYEDSMKSNADLQTNSIFANVFKVYYNKAQSGKSFTLMELTGFKVKHLKPSNFEHYMDTNIIVVPEKTCFEWKNKIQFHYKETYFIIDSTFKLKMFLNPNINNIDYNLIIVKDKFYNQLIDYLNNSNIYFPRLIFDSILNLENISIKSNTGVIKYLVTNNYLNLFMPYDNLYLQTKLLNNKQNKNTIINEFIKDFISILIQDIMELKLKLQVLDVLHSEFINNNYENSDVVKFINKMYNFTKNVFNPKFLNATEQNKHNLFNNTINDFKNQFQNKLDILKSYFIDFTEIKADYYYTHQEHTLIPCDQGNINTQINQLINAEKYIDIISLFKIQVKSVQNIVKTFANQDDQLHIQNLTERITTDKCLVCYEKPDIQIVTNCCQQLFCMSCLMMCYKQNMKCPLCRTEIKLNKLIVNESNFNSNQINKNMYDSLEKIIEYSGFNTRYANFENLIDYIVSIDDNPKIIINFTDYVFSYWYNKNSKSKKRYIKSNEYRNIIKKLQNKTLSFFDNVENSRNFETSYMQFMNKDSNMINVFINNNNYIDYNHFNYKDCGLGFGSAKYIINYNIDGYEIQKSLFRNIRYATPLVKETIINVIEDQRTFNKVKHPYFNHSAQIFNIKGC